MNIIKKKSEEQGWNVDLGGLARIWKVRRGCVARCVCVCGERASK
jgi:6-phosphogluconate dehydrogenase